MSYTFLHSTAAFERPTVRIIYENEIKSMNEADKIFFNIKHIKRIYKLKLIGEKLSFRILSHTNKYESKIDIIY